MVISDARVQNCDDDVGVADGDVPCIRDIDVRPGHAARLTSVPQAPESPVLKKRVGRKQVELPNIVGLHTLKLAGLPELIDSIPKRAGFLAGRCLRCLWQRVQKRPA